MAWAPVKPNHLDYANVQILLIGEDTDGSVPKHMDITKKDEKNEKVPPKEVLEELEEGDEYRVEHDMG